MTTPFTLRGDQVPSELVAGLARQTGAALEQPQDGTPVVTLLADVTDDRLAAALQPPTAACIEVVSGQAPDLSRLRLDGLYLDLSTMTAYGQEPAHQFLDAVAERVGLSEERRSMMELALHEALVNAMVHGNLEIGQISKESLDDFIQFCQLIETRLADPHYGPRRVVMFAQWPGETIDVTIEDVGPGYDAAILDEPVELEKKCGRGLFLIRDIAQEISIEEGGRRLVMRFAR